jgi:hypothetical protein
MGYELLAADCVLARLSVDSIPTSYVRQASPARLEVKLNRPSSCCHVEPFDFAQDKVRRNISQGPAVFALLALNGWPLWVKDEG